MNLQDATNLSLDMLKKFLYGIGIDGDSYINSSGVPHVFYWWPSEITNCDEEVELGGYYEAVDVFSMSLEELESSKLELVMLIKKYKFDVDTILKCSQFGAIGIHPYCRKNDKKLIKTIIHEYVHFCRSLLLSSDYDCEDDILEDCEFGFGLRDFDDNERNDLIYFEVNDNYEFDLLIEDACCELVANICYNFCDTNKDIFGIVREIRNKIKLQIDKIGDVDDMSYMMLFICDLVLRDKSCDFFRRMFINFEYLGKNDLHYCKSRYLKK